MKKLVLKGTIIIDDLNQLQVKTTEGVHILDDAIRFLLEKGGSSPKTEWGNVIITIEQP